LSAIEAQAIRVIGELAFLGELADARGAQGLTAATFAAILMLADAANEDGVKVDSEALGISAS
jgi:hypothetical protein